MRVLESLRSERRFAKIAATASGDTIVVPGVDGRRIVVLRYVLTANGATLLLFKSGSTAITGSFSIAADGDGLDPGMEPAGHFATELGENLVLNLSASVTVGGHLFDTLEPK